MNINQLTIKLKDYLSKRGGLSKAWEVLPPVQAYKAVQQMRTPQYKEQAKQFGRNVVDVGRGFVGETSAMFRGQYGGQNFEPQPQLKFQPQNKAQEIGSSLFEQSRLLTAYGRMGINQAFEKGGQALGQVARLNPFLGPKIMKAEEILANLGKAKAPLSEPVLTSKAGKIKLRIKPVAETPQTEAMRKVTLETEVPTRKTPQQIQAEGAIQRVKLRIEGMTKTELPTSKEVGQKIDKIPTKGALLGENLPQGTGKQIGQKTPSEKIIPQKKFFTWFDDLRRRLENEYHPVEKVSTLTRKKGIKVSPWQDPELLVKRNLGSTGIAEGELMGMGDIIRPHASELDDLNAYLVSKRALDLEGRGITTGIGANDARTTVATLGPKFKATADKLYMYQRSVLHNYLVDTGMLSEDAFQTIVRQNPNYVPFKRFFEEAGIEYVPKKGISLPIKRIKGSEREILNPLESMIENTYKAVTVGEQNRLWRSVANLGVQMPELGISKVPPKMVPVAQVEGKAIFRPSFFNPDKNTISFFENGNRVFYQVPEEIAKVANSLGNSTNVLLKLLSIPAKVIRTGATGANPEFALLRNPIRDQMSALWNSKTGYVPFLDLAKGISHFSGNDDLYRQYLLSGSGQSFMVSLDREFKSKTLAELIRGNVVFRKGGLLSKLQDVSQVTEIGTRLGEFQRGLKEYGEPLLATKGAREVSVDFGRIGKDMRVGNQLIPFINARIQGTIQAVKSAARNPVRAGILGVSLGSFPATLLYLHNRQYPEWQDIEDYEKQKNWIVLVGEPGKAKMFEIPKDYIFGQLFANSTENFLSYMDKTDPNALKNLAMNVGNFFSPASNIGEILPAAVKPIMEQAFNYNTFLRRQIVPEYQKALPPEAQYNKGTRELAKIIGSRVGISPNIIDNYLYGYLPGVFTEAINLIDFALGGKKLEDVTKLPFVRVFTVSGTGKIDREIKDAYYEVQDIKSTLSGIAKNQSYSKEQKKGLIEKQMQRMRDAVNKMNTYMEFQKGNVNAKFEPQKTSNVPYTPPGLAKEVQAVETTTTGTTTTEMDDFDELIAKEQLRYSDETMTQVGNTLYYKPDGWELGDAIKKADIEWTPPQVKATGIAELDKLTISSYKSAITARMKEIGILLDKGIITNEQASVQVGELAKLKVALSAPKKLKVKQPKFVPIKFGKRKKVTGLTKKKGIKLVRAPKLKGVKL